MNLKSLLQDLFSGLLLFIVCFLKSAYLFLLPVRSPSLCTLSDITRLFSWPPWLLTASSHHFIPDEDVSGTRWKLLQWFLLRSYWPPPLSTYFWPLIGLNSSASF